MRGAYAKSECKVRSKTRRSVRVYARVVAQARMLATRLYAIDICCHTPSPLRHTLAVTSYAYAIRCFFIADTAFFMLHAYSILLLAMRYYSWLLRGACIIDATPCCDALRLRVDYDASRYERHIMALRDAVI